MTITTMKEARERCAQLGITPARSLAETLTRIEHAEVVGQLTPLPEPVAAMAEAFEDMLVTGTGVIEVTKDYVIKQDIYFEQPPTFDAWPSREQTQGYHDTLADFIKAEVPADYVRLHPVMQRVADKRAAIKAAAEAELKRTEAKAVQHRLMRKKLRKGTKRAQRRAA